MKMNATEACINLLASRKESNLVISVRNKKPSWPKNPTHKMYKIFSEKLRNKYTEGMKSLKHLHCN